MCFQAIIFNVTEFRTAFCFCYILPHIRDRSFHLNTTKMSRSSHSDIVILQMENPIGESPILQLENQLRGNYDKNLFKYIETCLPISTLCVCSFLHNYFRPRFYFSLNGWQPWEVHRSTWPDVSLYSVFWNKEIDFLGFVIVLTYCILAIPFVRAISYIFQLICIIGKIKRDLCCMLLFQTIVLLG